LSEDIGLNEIKSEQVVDEIINAINHNIDSSNWLTDSEKEHFLECE
jgi:hypothetical protein